MRNEMKLLKNSGNLIEGSYCRAKGVESMSITLNVKKTTRQSIDYENLRGTEWRGVCIQNQNDLLGMKAGIANIIPCVKKFMCVL